MLGKGRIPQLHTILILLKVRQPVLVVLIVFHLHFGHGRLRWTRGVGEVAVWLLNLVEKALLCTVGDCSACCRGHVRIVEVPGWRAREGICVPAPPETAPGEPGYAYEEEGADY